MNALGSSWLFVGELTFENERVLIRPDFYRFQPLVANLRVSRPPNRFCEEIRDGESRVGKSGYLDADEDCPNQASILKGITDSLLLMFGYGDVE
jgi:hypothetical protein